MALQAPPLREAGWRPRPSASLRPAGTHMGGFDPPRPADHFSLAGFIALHGIA